MDEANKPQLAAVRSPIFDDTKQVQNVATYNGIIYDSTTTQNQPMHPASGQEIARRNNHTGANRWLRLNSQMHTKNVFCKGTAAVGVKMIT